MGYRECHHPVGPDVNTQCISRRPDRARPLVGQAHYSAHSFSWILECSKMSYGNSFSLPFSLLSFILVMECSKMHGGQSIWRSHSTITSHRYTSHRYLMCVNTIFFESFKQVLLKYSFLLFKSLASKQEHLEYNFSFFGFASKQTRKVWNPFSFF